MGISLSEAANQVGMTKAGIKKAIAKGRISAQKNEIGEWVLEPAELFRVYPPKKEVSTNQNEQVGDSIHNDNKTLEKEVQLLREQISDLKQQLSKSEGNHSQAMRLLEEQIVTVRQLTDQRKKKTEEGRGFWKRLLG
jgi:chromosome segregation ATPase